MPVRGRFRRSVTLACAVALATALACRTKPEEAAGPLVTVDVAPVLTADIQRTVRADAVVYPRQQAAIVPKVTAPISRAYVERGASVQAGQLLIELESRDLAGTALESQAAYAQAEALYQTAERATLPEDIQRAELEARGAKGVLEAQQAVFDNRQRLFQEGAIAQKDVNDAQVALTQARNQYEIARRRFEDLQGFASQSSLTAAAAQRDAARGRRDAAAAQLAYTKITSPIAGIVTDRPFYPGETPPSGAPVITVMDLTEVVARAHITQAEAADLRVGSDADLIGPDGGPVRGRVSQISPALDAGSTTVEVWLLAPNPDGVFKVGASVRVAIIARTVPGALVIPETAVLTSPSGTTAVIVVDAENQPSRETVTLGVRDSGKVEVTSGLKSGQRVVTTGAFELGKLDDEVLAKTKVKIQPPKDDDDR